MKVSSAAAQIANNIGVVRTLDPDRLIEAGILSNPDKPEGAYRLARGLVRQGQYKEARNLLYPHARTAPCGLRPKIAELLGVCAIHSGGEWRELLEAAACGYAQYGEQASVAQVRQHIGDMLLVLGEFKAADDNYLEASKAFRAAGETARAALADCMRARVRLRAGHIESALACVDRALTELMPLRRARDEGIARLDRALILAYLGDRSTCAKELLSAERMLATTGNRSDQVRTRLARAETLLILGDTRRACAGLRRLLADVVDLEDIATRAHVHMLLGRALLTDKPPNARRNLMRAKHLYQSIDSAFGLANCELFLAQIEHRLGFAVHGRLRSLTASPLDQWPLFAAELRAVRAETIADSSPDLARSLLFEARKFAVRSGNRSLARTTDLCLRRARLVASDDLTPIEDEKTTPMVQGGATTTQGHVPAGGPDPMVEDETVRDLVVVTNVERTRAERLVRRTISSPSLTLTPPRASGVSLSG